MTVKKINGWIIIRDVIEGYLVTRKYMGYSVKESKKMFKEEFNSDL